MMNDNKIKKSLFICIIWGSMWGIFEATVGYLVHLFSFGYSWVIWYPSACFFMMNVYRRTEQKYSILYVGLFCAAIKMLNLFLPGRIDKVINPAISILFETLVMFGVIIAINHLSIEKPKNPFIKAFTVFSMNTGWRLLFILYLIIFVPNWIRNVSVISSVKYFISFFITQNIITSVLIFIGFQLKNVFLKPVIILEKNILNWFNTIPKRAIPFLKTSLATLMLCTNITLQFILK